MKVEKMTNLALLLVLTLCMSQPLITDAWATYRYVVHIRSGLSKDSKYHILQAHCKSGNQDISL
jgi:hypothetical protein